MAGIGAASVYDRVAPRAAARRGACDRSPFGQVPPASQSAQAGYLPKEKLQDIDYWIPLPPAAGSVEADLDFDIYMSTRRLLHEPTDPRALEAAEDDVYEASTLLARYRDALGVSLDQQNAPTLVALLDKAERDAAVFLAPMK